MCNNVNMEDFIKIEKIGEGTYGIVYKGKHKATAKLVAMKKIRLDNEDEGVPPTAIREIALLKEVKHPNIVTLQYVLLEETRLYLIFEYLSMDLRKYLDRFNPGYHMHYKLVKSYLFQINNAILFCHQRRIIHRDLKPQNLLINQEGVIKVADFGLARAIGVPIRPYTHEVVTLWYRAPEVLLGCTRYGSPIDIWSLACIFSEMASKRTLFQGDSEIGQLYRIFRVLTTPSEDTWQGVTVLPEFKAVFPNWTKNRLKEALRNMDKDAIDLISKMLICDPAKRISAREIAQHAYLQNVDTTIKPVFK